MYNPRLQIQLESKNSIKIKDALTLINNNILQKDELDFPYELNITSTGVLKSDQIIYILNSNYLLLSSKKAETIYDFIKNNIPTQTNGKISLHLCPTGEINNWQGCKDDLRAQYKEFVF